MPTFGSLFSGVGGLDLGLERAGWECRWQVEIDPFCRAVLTKHWPAVPTYADVRELSGNELEPVDLLAGGFPCQDVSNAGKRQGLAGAHSGLWSEFARLIRVVRPRLVLVENVPGLLGRGMGTVLGDLAALGVDAEWDCVPAAAVGAPHIRDRVFIVGYRPSALAGWARGHGVLANSARYRERADQDESPRPAKPQDGAHAERGSTAVADPDRERFQEQQRAEPGNASAGRSAQPERSSWWAIEPAVGRVADGVPGRVGQLRALGNAVVPQVAEWLGRRLLTALEVS